MCFVTIKESDSKLTSDRFSPMTAEDVTINLGLTVVLIGYLKLTVWETISYWLNMWTGLAFCRSWRYSLRVDFVTSRGRQPNLLPRIMISLLLRALTTFLSCHHHRCSGCFFSNLAMAPRICLMAFSAILLFDAENLKAWKEMLFSRKKSWTLLDMTLVSWSKLTEITLWPFSPKVALWFSKTSLKARIMDSALLLFFKMATYM